MTKPSELDMAYFAGLVDGEGHVRASLQTNALVLCMADIPILEWCRDHIGGKLSNSWKAEGGNSRPRRMWWLSHRVERAVILPRVIPHLILKRREAELLYELTLHQDCRRSVKLTPAWVERRAELIAAVRAANRARH